jgi:tRNA threonylcarbamoyladenosine biosynthesis protein TsaB
MKEFGVFRLFLPKLQTFGPMAKLLLIETATDVCSVAVSEQGQVMATEEQQAVLSHTALLTLQISEVLRHSGLTLRELSGVAVSSGPGSYTALRTGVATAKGICYALNIPLIGINTLQALAAGAAAGNPADVYISMIDARRDEVWLAAFDAKLNRLNNDQPLILSVENWTTWTEQELGEYSKKRIILSGNGSKKINNGFLKKNLDICSVECCSARFLAQLAHQSWLNQQFESLPYFEPTYMKPPNVTTPKSRESVNF